MICQCLRTVFLLTTLLGSCLSTLNDNQNAGKNREDLEDSQTSNQLNLMDDEQKYLGQFAQAMSDFKPQETFYFNLTTYEQQDFIFWPSTQVKQLRGVYYISEGVDENQDAGKNSGLSLTCYTGGKIVEVQQSRRLGVFQVPFQSGVMKLIFKSDMRDLTVYLSYELIEAGRVQKKTPVPQSAKNNEQGQQINKEQVIPQPGLKEEQTPMKKILERYKTVEIQITGQEQILKGINHFTSHNIIKIEDQFFWIKFRMTMQTLMVVGSGLVCLFLLHKKLSKGYELLV